MFQLKANSVFYLTITFLIVLTIVDPFQLHLVAYLENILSSITICLEILFDLKSVVEAGASSKLVFLAGSSENIADTLSSGIRYLSWSELLISLQILLVKITSTVYIKLFVILAFFGTFLINYRSISTKILVVLLFVNPGLPAFITSVKYMAQELKLDYSKPLAADLNKVHEKYKQKELNYEAFKKNRDLKQLKNNESKGESKLNFFQKVEDTSEDDLHHLANDIEEGIGELVLIIKTASKKLVIATINIFTSVALQFLLLPLLFFYGLKFLLKISFSKSIENQNDTLQRIIIFESMFVLLIGISTIVSCKNNKTTQVVAPSKKIIVPKRISKQEETLKPHLGIDVSHFQNKINWEEIKKANISFAYTKATQGVDYVDPKFHVNWENMKKVQMAKGAYHFYDSDHSGREQAYHFIKVVGAKEAGDIPPVLDIEGGSIKGNVDELKLQQEVKIWLKIVEDHFKVKPIIYTNNEFANKYLKQSDLSTYHLWIAEYGVEKPRIPEAWKGKKWLIWQRTPKGSIEGVVGDVDHDITEINIKRLIKD